MAFNIQQAKDAKSLSLILSGQFDEEVSLDGVGVEGINAIAIDFDQVELINSCGVREWIKWISKVSPDTAMTFRRVPKVFITQMNTVVKFFPPQTNVESFYVPYVCESCDVFKNVVYRSGVEFDGAQLTASIDVPCDKCRKQMEVDVVPEKYFRFLQRSK